MTAPIEISKLFEARKALTDNIVNLNGQYIARDKVIEQTNEQIDKIDELILKLTTKDNYDSTNR